MITQESLSAFGLFLEYRGPLFRRKALPIMIQEDVVITPTKSFIADGYGFKDRGVSIIIAHGQISGSRNEHEISLRMIQMSAARTAQLHLHGLLWASPSPGLRRGRAAL